MTTTPKAAKRIPTRPRCARCQQYITIDTHADDDLWAEVIGERFGPGYICADCFTRAADERLIDWADRLKLIPISHARHRATIAALQPDHKLREALEQIDRFSTDAIEADTDTPFSELEIIRRITRKALATDARTECTNDSGIHASINPAMVLVPREPTDAMLLAAGQGPWVNPLKAKAVWTAMIAVATKPEGEAG